MISPLKDSGVPEKFLEESMEKTDSGVVRYLTALFLEESVADQLANILWKDYVQK